MTLKFDKCRTIGNEFLIVDNRDGSFNSLAEDTQFKHFLNHRIFGVGATGLVEVREHEKYAFQMLYHVGTGEKGLACGTGSRALVAWAKKKGLAKPGVPFEFWSYEGARSVTVTEDDFVVTSMSNDCKILEVLDGDNYFTSVGVFVHTRFTVDDVYAHDVVTEGFTVTERAEYQGIFPQPTVMLASVISPGNIRVRCYDRSTNADTEQYACGTGELGAAISYLKREGLYGDQQVTVRWRDGETVASMVRSKDDVFSNVTLAGRAVYLFSGQVEVEEFMESYAGLAPYVPDDESESEVKA